MKNNFPAKYLVGINLSIDNLGYLLKRLSIHLELTKKHSKVVSIIRINEMLPIIEMLKEYVELLESSMVKEDFIDENVNLFSEKVGS